jgi:hypothetical protein
MSKASINRSYSTPNDLFFETEKLVKKMNSNLNQAHNEGLKLWVRKIKRVLKEQDSDEAQ